MVTPCGPMGDGYSGSPPPPGTFSIPAAFRGGVGLSVSREFLGLFFRVFGWMAVGPTIAIHPSPGPAHPTSQESRPPPLSGVLWAFVPTPESVEFLQVHRVGFEHALAPQGPACPPIIPTEINGDLRRLCSVF